MSSKHKTGTRKTNFLGFDAFVPVSGDEGCRALGFVEGNIVDHAKVSPKVEILDGVANVVSRYSCSHCEDELEVVPGMKLAKSPANQGFQA